MPVWGTSASVPWVQLSASGSALVGYLVKLKHPSESINTPV